MQLLSAFRQGPCKRDDSTLCDIQTGNILWDSKVKDLQKAVGLAVIERLIDIMREGPENMLAIQWDNDRRSLQEDQLSGRHDIQTRKVGPPAQKCHLPSRQSVGSRLQARALVT